MDSTVSIRSTYGDTQTAIARALDDIGGIGDIANAGDRVIIKPNANGTECVTSIEFVEAVVALLKDHSINDIAIAEATFGNASTTYSLLKKNGYFELALRLDLEVINLNDSEAVEVAVENPLVKPTLRIAREIVEADALINLPVMKVHYATGITMCLKNMKGILVGDEKRTFHEIGLSKAIVNLRN